MKETRPDTETPEPSKEALRVQRAYERLGEQAKTRDGTGTNTDKTPYRNKPFDSSFQSMLFGSAGTLAKPAWSDSTKGRMTIRLLTRGVFGAAMFAAAGRYSRIKLANYDPQTFEWANAASNPLQAIAKVSDVVLGKPIAQMARFFTNTKGMTEAEALLAKENAAWNAVNFRGTTYTHSLAGRMNHQNMPSNARSLGAEMVSVSFDFAMMSVGDALGRNFIQMIDPNIRKTWMVNDQGQKAKEGEKAHFSPTKFVRSLGWSAWRIISKNQGEDWAVALPYVYQMRLQRKLLSRAFSDDGNGVKVVLDNSWNGGAFKVNNEGKILGDYSLVGALDLHTRFVGYNVYTLMFREAYDTIGHKLKVWRDEGYPLHVEMPKDMNPLHLAKDTTRYIVKSFIKANLYMNPSVVPFWMMRTPQTKWRGAFINGEAALGTNAIAATMSHSDQVTQMVQEAAAAGKHITEGDILVRQPGMPPIFNYSTTRFRAQPGKASNFEGADIYLHNTRVSNPLAGMKNQHDWRIYDSYEKGFGTTFSKALNPFGQFSNWVGTQAEKLGEALPNGKIKDFIGIEDSLAIGGKTGKAATSEAGRRAFMHSFTDASLAYTPYFIAKAEGALRVDDTPNTGGRGKMDNAIYGLIDNVCALSPRKTAASIQEIWRLSSTRERALIMREGNENHPDTIAPVQAHHVKASAKPATVVHPEGREKQQTVVPAIKMGAELSQTDSSESDKRWAESVAGKNLEAQFQQGNSHTRH